MLHNTSRVAEVRTTEEYLECICHEVSTAARKRAAPQTALELADPRGLSP